MTPIEAEQILRHAAALDAEAARLRAQLPGGAGAGTSFPIGRDELFSAVEKTRMPMILTDPNQPDDPIIFANRAFQELSGYGAEELIGRNCRFLQGPDTNPDDVQRIREALAANREIAIEILNHRRDGTGFVNELFISPVFDHDGRLLYHFGSQLDMTGHHRDRRRLEASERRQRAIFDSAVEFAIVATDQQGRVTDWNTGAENILGWTAAEMLGNSAEIFFTFEDQLADQMGTEMRLALAEGRASDERWHVRRDGTRIWASGEMMPLRAEDDEHIGFIKILRDRTAEHLARIALRGQEQRRKALFELTDRLAERDADVADLADDTCAILGRTLGVRLVGYGTVNPATETVTIERDWTTDGADAPVTTLGFGDLGGTIDDLERGETVIVEDVRTDPRMRGLAETLAARGVRAFVNTPVFEYGRLVALLYVGTAEARAWTVEELLFIREAAARTRTTIARKQAETALRASELELRQVADVLPFLVSFVDRTLTYRFANAAYRDWLGLPPEAIVGRTVRDVVGAPGAAARRPAFERALAGEPVRFDLDWPTPDGRRRVADITYTPRRDAAGSVTGVYIVVQDVTALRDASATLTERAHVLTREVAGRKADLDRVWRLSQELLAVALPDGTLEAVSPLWTELLGWSEGELIGSSLVEYAHPDDIERTRTVFAGILRKPLSTPYEYRFRHRDGSYRWFGWTAAFEDGRIYAAGRDTTVERQQAEQLAQSQKMEAVGQLTGGLAHDFNNLLTGVIGSLELMGTRIGQGRIKDLDRYIGAAQGAAGRAAALTHRLLAFSRRQTLDPKATDANRLVAGLEDLIRRTVGPAITVEVVGAGGLWPILVDPNQLENALLNLCINARDAMPEGGRITVETGNRWLDQRAGGERDLEPGQYVSLCVTDTGTGMAPEVIAKAFDPFFTTKPIGQGTGLGLSMIYGFVRQSGGGARIYSEPGQGTTVCLYLPRHLGEAEAAESRLEPAGLPRAVQGETVLVVDDEPTVRMLVTEVLEELGYAAIEAADGAAGLRVLQSNARVDLLVTDVGLPGGMNGRQMADAARVGRPGLKVLFITGYAENAVLGNGQLDRGMHVMTKPFATEALAGRIRTLITGR